MQANELRIGNWVQHEGRPFKVYATDMKFVHCDWATGMKFVHCDWATGIKIDLIEPIPLTPEILEKAGLTAKPLSHKEYLHNEIGLNEGGAYEYVIDSFTDDYGNWTPCTIDITYLHQLQNLYFAVTGEELQINELTVSKAAL